MKSDGHGIRNALTSTLTGMVIVRYLLFFIVGTVLVVASAPSKRAAIVEERLKQAADRLGAGLEDTALSELMEVEPWARNYPALSRKLDCDIVRCQVRRGDLKSAQATASKMFAHEHLTGTKPSGMWSWLMTPMVAWKNRSLNEEALPNSAGFETLERELTESGQLIQLARVRRIRDVLEGVVAEVPEPVSPEPEPSSFTPKEEPPEVAATPAVSIPEPAESQPTQMAVVVEEEPPPVEIDPNLQWGVIVVPHAGVYTKKGKVVGDMSAGDLIEVVDVVSTKAGDLAVSRIPDADGNVEELVVKLAHVHLRPGGLATAMPDEVDLRVERGKLLARMEARRREVHAKRKARNPHAAEYQKAKQAHKEFWKKVEDLKKRRDASEGADHVDLEFELSKMKGDDIRLAKSLEAARRKYKDWMKQNSGPGDDELTDSEMVKMMEELSDIELDLARMM